MTVDILEEASLWRSLRRLFTTEADNRHLSPVVIEKNKRWHKGENEKVKSARSSMRERYVDLYLQLEKELTFPPALWLMKKILFGPCFFNMFMIFKWQSEFLVNYHVFVYEITLNWRKVVPKSFLGFYFGEIQQNTHVLSHQQCVYQQGTNRTYYSHSCSYSRELVFERLVTYPPLFLYFFLSCLCSSL